MSDDDFALKMAVRRQQQSLIGRGIRRDPIQKDYELDEERHKKKRGKKRRGKLNARHLPLSKVPI